MYRFLISLLLLAPLFAQEPSRDAQVADALRESRDRLAAADSDPEAWVARARTLLQAGLGTASRQAAARAVELAPDLAASHRTLGQALSADSVGRMLVGDFDHQGAEAAFRRALELDSENPEARFGLALVLEHDSHGRRYASDARLEEAASHYAELLRIDAKPAAVRSLAALLLRMQRYEELRELLEKAALPGAEPLHAAAIAALEGPPTAVNWVKQTSPEDQFRRVLSSAATLLTQVRAYRPAAGLIAAASRGSVNAQKLIGQATVLENMRPYEQVELPADDPSSVGYRMLIDLYSELPVEQLFEHRSKHARRLLDNEAYMTTYRREVEMQRQALRRSGLSSEAALDIAMSRRRARAEGDDAMGYRVEAVLGGRPAVYFVVKEDEEYRLLDTVSRPGDPMTDLAHEVLRRVDSGRVDLARRLLVWAYDRRQASDESTADPMSGPVFARFWEPEAAVGLDEARWAAATLLAESAHDAARAVEILRPAREQAKDDAGRARFDIALATAYSSLGRDQEFLDSARSLYRHFKDSYLAFQALSAALAANAEYQELDALVASRLKKNRRDLTAWQMKMQAAVQRSDLAGARDAAKELGERRELGPAELNNLAWAALSSDSVDAIAVQQIEQAKEMLKKTPSPALLNTAAALYGEQGRIVDARRDLLLSMRLSGLSVPNSDSWYVFGRIAEQLGELDAAREIYGRVEPPARKSERPTSTHAFAQRRLQAMSAE